MPAPSDIRAQVDPILTTFALGYKPQQNLIGHLVAPEVPVLSTTGTIHTYGKEGFRIHDSKRAARAHPKKLDFGMNKDTYACVEHSLAGELDLEAELEEAARVGGAALQDKMERQAVLTVQNSLELEREKAVADSVFAAANYESGNKVTLAGNDQWIASGGGQGSTSNPIDDINTGIAAARDDMGIKPNTLTFGFSSWKALTQHSDIKDIVKYSQMAVITEEMIKQIFGVQYVNVGEAVYSSDGDTFSDIWGDHVSITYTPPAAEMAEGTTPHTVTFNLAGYPIVKTYDDAINRNYLVFRKYQVKLISDKYGYLISDTDGNV